MSSIQELELEFNQDIIIILGTNGSGKTSLLQELFPSATRGNIFIKEGKKILEITDNNNTYTIITEKQPTESTLTHRFLINEQNVNQNHSFTVQSELIENHFNLTPLKKSIFTNSIRITDMGYSKRKQFFTKINPHDLLSLLSYIENVKKQKKSIKNNIQLLEHRKVTLTSQLLKPEDIKKIKQSIERLSKQLNFHISIQNYAKHEYAKLANIDTTLPDITYKSLSGLLFKIQGYFDKYKIQSPEGLQKQISEIQTQIQLFQKEHDIYLTKAKDLSNEINSLVEQSTKSEKFTSQLLHSIKSIEKQMNKYKPDNESIQPIPESELKYESTILSEIKNHIEPIVSIKNQIPSKLLNSSILPKIHSALEKTNKELTLVQESIDITKNKLKQLQKKLPADHHIPCEIDNNTTYTSTCTILKSYKTFYNSISTDIEQYTKELSTLKTKLTKLQSKHSKLSTYHQTISIFNKHYLSIVNIFDTHPYLFNILSKDKIIQILKSSQPYTLINVVSEYYAQSKKYYTYQQLQSKHNQLVNEYNSIKSNKYTSSTLIQRLLSTKKSELDSLSSKLQSLQKKLKVFNFTLAQLNECNEAINEFNSLQSQYQEAIETLEQHLNKTFYSTLVEHESSIIKDLNNQILTLENKLKEQEFIRVRLEQEIDQQLQNLYQKQQLLADIEQSLTAINNTYNFSFLRNILQNVNMILNQIFIYNIQVYNPYLESSDLPDNLDTNELFQFSVKIDDETEIEDISQCSSGQKDMINFAFNLAILLELKFTNYPIFLDEIDRALDNIHRERLLLFLKSIIDQKLVTQIFLVSNTYFHEALLGQYIILDNRIGIDATYNQNVTIVKQ